MMKVTRPAKEHQDANMSFELIGVGPLLLFIFFVEKKRKKQSAIVTIMVIFK